MPHDTPQQSITAIREALIDVEEAYPDSHSVKVLHRELLKGFRAHGHRLVDEGEIEPLAGGGTPKLPPPPGG
jgi:hypothetical protein